VLTNVFHSWQIAAEAALKQSGWLESANWALSNQPETALRSAPGR